MEQITVVLHKLIDSFICHKCVQEIVCYSVFPKYNRLDNTIVHPCKESCIKVKKACLSPIRKDNLTGDENITRSLLQLTRNAKVPPVDCDYLSSRYGSIPCFYKPVTCETPSNVTNVETKSKRTTYRVSSGME